MNLQNWLANGWLRPHQTSPEEIRNLWAIAVRDLTDAATERLSSDWQFNIAYNAALQLCTLLLRAEGFSPAKGQLSHYRVLQSLPLTLGPKWKESADYLDACRNKRNQVEYDSAGRTSKKDAAELIQFAGELREAVLAWLKAKHPKLVP